MKLLTTHAERGMQHMHFLHPYWMLSSNKKQDYAGAGTGGAAIYFLIAAPFRGMKIAAGGVIPNFLE